MAAASVVLKETIGGFALKWLRRYLWPILSDQLPITSPYNEVYGVSDTILSNNCHNFRTPMGSQPPSSPQLMCKYTTRLSCCRRCAWHSKRARYVFPFVFYNIFFGSPCCCIRLSLPLLLLLPSTLFILCVSSLLIHLLPPPPHHTVPHPPVPLAARFFRVNKPLNR